MSANETADHTAVMQAIHEQATAAFDDDAFDDNARPWSSRDIADRVMVGHPDQDSLAMRILAGRIAAGPPPQSSDPLQELEDFARTLGAIASATSSIITRWHDANDLEPEQVDEFRETVQSLVTASRGLDEMSGWF